MIGKEILNYKIIKLIGKGGMGTVYLAEHKYIRQQKVAIKVLHSDIVNDYTREKLTQEAEHLASLDHPNIVKLINYHIDDDGNIFLIEEYADGVTLESFINEVNGLVVEDRVCGLFEPILDAVGYAHSKGILHRDLKPSNIIINKEGVPKILDFGIATIIGRDAEEEKFIVGTPSYMSPEQVKGETLDQRSDIYALGVILHQMMTGNAPYDTTTLSEHEINNKVVNEPLAPMRSFYKYVSPKSQQVVDKATSKNPGDRYQSCGDFRKSLHRAIYPPKVPKWVWGTAAAVLCVIIGGGFYWWDYTRTKVNYFKDYTEVWGEPVGIGKLSSSDYSHIHRAYRIESSRGKVRRLSHVNSIGTIIADTESERVDRPLDAVYSYTPEGKVMRVKVMDHNGKVQYVKSYSENLKTVVFQFDDEHGTEKTLGASMIGYTNAFDNRSIEGRGKISRYHLTYDDNGYVVRTEYAGLYNARVHDADNIYGRAYIRDDKGRIIEESYLNIDGSPVSTKWGLGIKTFNYDSSDNWIGTKYLTIERTPSLDAPDGTAGYLLSYDRYGNMTESHHLNGDEELMIPKRMGYAMTRLQYDDKGYIKRAELFGPDEELIIGPEGYAAFEAECDENGFFNIKRFYDTEGNLCRIKNNAAILRNVNDAHGNQLVMTGYDENDTPILIDNAYFRQEAKYDSLGNITSIFFYDTRGDLTTNPEWGGVAGVSFVFDEFNRITRRVNFNTDSVASPSDFNITTEIREYDVRGNMTKYAYFEDEAATVPQENLNGTSGAEYAYDDNGNQISITFFGKDGNATFDNEHVAQYKNEFDENGNMLSVRYFAPSGQPVLNTMRIAGKDWKYDEHGNMTEEKFVDIKGNIAKGYLVTRHKYDSDGNRIETAYFDGSNNPAINNENIHKTVTKYNSQRQETEQAYFDTNGNPTLNSIKKISIVRYEYDNFGNIIQVSYFDTRNRPAESNEHYAIHKSEYDAMGRIVRQLYFTTDGRPTDPAIMVPEGMTGYDRNGNLNFVASGDGHGNYIHNQAIGACIMRWKYDAKKRPVEQSYFDKNDKPIISTVNGFHKSTAKYDVAGNLTEIAYFDSQNKPMRKKPEGYHRKVTAYDELNRSVSDTYYTPDGKQVAPNGYGFSKAVYSYNDNTNTASRVKLYSPGGAVVASMRWNGHEWQPEASGASSPTATVQSTGGEWQGVIEAMASQCPFDLGEEALHLTITGAKVTGSNSCELTFSTAESSYDMPDETLNTYKSSMEFLGQNFASQFPSNVRTTIILRDKRNRELWKKTF